MFIILGKLLNIFNPVIWFAYFVFNKKIYEVALTNSLVQNISIVRIEAEFVETNTDRKLLLPAFTDLFFVCLGYNLLYNLLCVAFEQNCWTRYKSVKNFSQLKSLCIMIHVRCACACVVFLLRTKVSDPCKVKL